MPRNLIAFCFLILSACINQLYAQIDGDNIFETDQIISIELNFSQPGFWDSLLLNYETEIYMKADLTLTDLTGTTSFNDVGVRLKGNSSFSHPGNKKSFKIDFNEYVSGQNYDGLKKLNFSNGFKDPTLMREKIFFDICRLAEVPAPRANFANVYFNGELWGFYTVVEQIDDQFLDWRILDDDGNLFKAGDNFGGAPGGGDEADLIYYGPDQTDYESRYELKTNETENDWTDLIEFTAFINNSSSSEFESELENHVELQEYLRSAALDNLFVNLDSYTESARNYYLYHNLTTDKWEWIKWDGNEAFGTYAPGLGGMDLTTLILDYHGNDRPLLENVMNSSALYDQYLSELCFLTDNYFNAPYMDTMIQSIKTLIQSSVYADNNKMYSNSNFDTNIENNISGGGGPMGGTVYGLKSFVQERNTYVNSVLDCSLISDVHQLDPASLMIYPNPVNAQLTLEWGETSFLFASLRNSLGKEIYRESTIGKTGTQIDVSNLSNGIYFISLYADAENRSVLTRTVVVNK